MTFAVEDDEGSDAIIRRTEEKPSASTTVEVVDETVATVGNGSAAVATDGSTLHPLFADIDDDEYTDSVLEIQR